jgi:hypothetical protein
MSVHLNLRLEANGCDIGLRTFKGMLVTTHSEQYPDWSVDELLLHPDEAKYFCDIVRRRFNVFGLPDDLVLRCLVANRKNKINRAESRA